MAAAKFVDVAADLEKLVTCSICNGIMNVPKALTCLHTFCLKCIEGWYKQRKTDRKAFDCPSCRTPVKVEADDVNNLPTAFDHNALIELYTTIKRRNTIEGDQQLLPCSSCSNNSVVVVGFCPQCGAGKICDECYKAHSTMKSFKETHQATLWSKFDKKTISSFLDNNSFCQEKHHTNCRLEYYCEECKKTLCQKCEVTQKHTNHSIVSIEEASEEAQQRLGQEKRRLQEVVEMHENEKRLSSENRQRIQNQVDALDAQLHDDLQAINNIVQEKMQAHRMKLKKYLEQQTTDNDEEKCSIDGRLQQASSLRNQCENLENINLKQFILEGHEKFEEVCHNVKGTPILPTRPLERYSSVRYVPYKEILQILEDLQLGEIEVSVTEPSRCTIESLYQARLGSTNHFNVVTRDTEGNECYTDEALIDVQVLDGDGNQVEKEIIQSQPGRCVVKYEAQKLSPYKIEVSIGGRPVSNSPQEVETFEAQALCIPVKVFALHNVTNGIALAVNDSGMIAVVDARLPLISSSKISLYSADGKFLREFGGEGATRETRTYDAKGIVFSDDDEILVSDQHDKHGFIKQFDIDGNYKRSIVKQSGMEFKRMCTTEQSIACLARDQQSKETLIRLFRKKTCDHLQDIKLDISHNGIPRYVSYYSKKYSVTFINHNKIFVFDENGALHDRYGEFGSGEGELNEPRGLAMFHDSYATLLVCDMCNHRVQMFNYEGEPIASFGSRGSGLGQMDGPTDVAITADGRVLVLENKNQRIQVFR